MKEGGKKERRKKLCSSSIKLKIGWLNVLTAEKVINHLHIQIRSVLVLFMAMQSLMSLCTSIDYNKYFTTCTIWSKQSGPDADIEHTLIHFVHWIDNRQRKKRQKIYGSGNQSFFSFIWLVSYLRSFSRAIANINNSQMQNFIRFYTNSPVRRIGNEREMRKFHSLYHWWFSEK